MAAAGPTALDGSIGKPAFMHTSIMFDMLLPHSWDPLGPSIRKLSR